MTGQSIVDACGDFGVVPQVTACERASRYDRQAPRFGIVDGGEHERLADAVAVDGVRDAGVDQHEAVRRALVGELGDVAVDRRGEAVVRSVVDDRRAVGHCL